MRRNRSKAVGAGAASLPPDMLASIHGRLSPLDRLAFAAAFRASRDAFRPEAPWLVIPGDAPTLYSLSDRCPVTAHAPGPDHAVLGSSCCGWLVTADDRAWLRLVNPVTGERRALPAITTIPWLFRTSGGEKSNLTLVLKWFLRAPRSYPYGTGTMSADLLRRSLYRKVVLSDFATVAMLITGPKYGVAAFATSEGGAWRLAPPRDGVEPVATSEDGPWSMARSPNGVEDAVHHKGRFYSITYAGEVEAWEERDAAAAGVFTSVVVALSLLLPADTNRVGGRLMIVLKETMGRRTLPSFTVRVLHAGGDEWEETDDIGDAALFVGGNSSLCVSAKEHPELRAGCVYYTEEDGLHGVGVWVLSFKDGTVEKVEGLGVHRRWPLLEWFTPSNP